MKIRLLSNQIVVARQKAEDKTPGGIALPTSSKTLTNEGTVTHVGPGKKLENGDIPEMPVKVKDRVLFVHGAGVEIKVEGKPYLFMTDEDIIAVIEN